MKKFLSYFLAVILFPIYFVIMLFPAIIVCICSWFSLTAETFNSIIDED